jgi:hypothetical protein
VETIDEALAFAVSVHSAQKIEGIWLCNHPFVEAVRAGVARREEIARWVTQVFCITRNFDELLQSLHVVPVARCLVGMRRDLGLLIDLGEAVGLSRTNMLDAEPNKTTVRIQEWANEYVSDPDKFLIAQVCAELLGNMKAEVGAYLAEGSEKHYGLKHEQIRYFTVCMGTDHDSDKEAAELLKLVPKEKWECVHQQTLTQNRLIHTMYNSIGDMWSSW